MGGTLSQLATCMHATGKIFNAGAIAVIRFGTGAAPAHCKSAHCSLGCKDNLERYDEEALKRILETKNYKLSSPHVSDRTSMLNKLFAGREVNIPSGNGASAVFIRTELIVEIFKYNSF